MRQEYVVLFVNAMANFSRTPSAVLPVNLRAALEEAGRTQEWLAREINVSLRQVQKYVAGDAEPNGKRLVAMANALDCDASWFYMDHTITEEVA